MKPIKKQIAMSILQMCKTLILGNVIHMFLYGIYLLKALMYVCMHSTYDNNHH